MVFRHAPIEQTAEEDGLAFLNTLRQKAKALKFMSTEEVLTFVEWFRLNEVRFPALLKNSKTKTRGLLLLSACDLLKVLRESLKDCAEGDTRDIVVMNNIHLYRVVASLVAQLAMCDERDDDDNAEQLHDFRTLVTSLERYKMFMHTSSETDHEVITKVGRVIGSIPWDVAAVSDVLKTKAFDSQHLKYLLLVSMLATKDRNLKNGQECPKGTSLSELDKLLADKMGREVLDTVRSDGEGESLVSQMKAFKHTVNYLSILLKKSKETLGYEKLQNEVNAVGDSQVKEYKHNQDVLKTLVSQIKAFKHTEKCMSILLKETLEYARLQNETEFKKLQNEVNDLDDPQVKEMSRQLELYKHNQKLLLAGTIGTDRPDAAVSESQDFMKDTLSFLKRLENDVAQCTASDKIAMLLTFAEGFKLTSLSEVREYTLIAVCELLRVLQQSLGDSAEGDAGDIVVMNNIYLYRVVASLVAQLAMYDAGDGITHAEQLDDFRTLVTSLDTERYKMFMHASSETDHEVITKVGRVIGSILSDFAAVSDVVALKTKAFDSQHLKYQFLVSVLEAKDPDLVNAKDPDPVNAKDPSSPQEQPRIAKDLSNLQPRNAEDLSNLQPRNAEDLSNPKELLVRNAKDLSNLQKIHEEECPEGTSLSLRASLWVGTLVDLLVFSRVVKAKPSNKEGEESLVHSNGVLYQRIPILGEQQGIMQFPDEVRKTVVDCLMGLLKRDRVTPDELMALLTEKNKMIVDKLTKAIGKSSAKVRHKAVLACYEVIDSGELDKPLADKMGREVLDTVRSDGEGESLVSQMKAFKHTVNYLSILLKKSKETLGYEKLQNEVNAVGDSQLKEMSRRALELYKHNQDVLATIGLCSNAAAVSGPQLPARNGLQDFANDILSFLRGLKNWAKDVAQCEASERVAKLQNFVKGFKLNEVKLSSLPEIRSSKLAAEYMLEAVCELLRVLQQSLEDSAEGDAGDIVVMNNIYLYRVVASLVAQLAMYDVGELDDFRTLVTSLDTERYKMFMHASSETDHEVITKVGRVIGKSILSDVAAVASSVVALKTFGFDTKTFEAAGRGVVGLINISDTWNTQEEVKTAATCNALSQRLKYLLLVSSTTNDGTKASEYLKNLVKRFHEKMKQGIGKKALPASLWAGTLADLLVFSRVVSSEPTNGTEYESLIHSNGVLYQRIPVAGEQQVVTQFPPGVRKEMVNCLMNLLKQGRTTPRQLKTQLVEATKFLGEVHDEASKIVESEELAEKLKGIFDEEKIKTLKAFDEGMQAVVVGLTASSGGNKGASVRHRAVLACYEVVESGELDCELAKEMFKEMLETLGSENEGKRLELAGRVFGKARQYLRMTLRTEAETYKNDMEELLQEVEKLLEHRRGVSNEEARNHVDRLLKEAQKAVQVYATNLEGLNAIAGTTLLLTASIFDRVAGIDRQLQDMKKEVSDIHTYLKLYRKLGNDITALYDNRDFGQCDRYSFMSVTGTISCKEEIGSPSEFAKQLRDELFEVKSHIFGMHWGKEFMSLVEKELWKLYFSEEKEIQQSSGQKKSSRVLLPLHVFMPATKKPTTNLVEEALLQQHRFTMRNVQRLQEKTKETKVHLVLILVGYSFLDKEFHLDSMREKNRLHEWGNPTILVAADTAVFEYTLEMLFGTKMDDQRKSCEVYKMKDMTIEDTSQVLGTEDASIGSVLRGALLFPMFCEETIKSPHVGDLSLRMLLSLVKAINADDNKQGFWSLDNVEARKFGSSLLESVTKEQKSLKEDFAALGELEDQRDVSWDKLVSNVMEKVAKEKWSKSSATLTKLKKLNDFKNVDKLKEKEMDAEFLITCLEEYLRLSLKELNTKHPSITDGDLIGLMMHYNSLLALDMTRRHSLQAPYKSRCNSFLETKHTEYDVNKLDQQLVRDLFTASPVKVKDGKKGDTGRMYEFMYPWMQKMFTAIAVRDKLMQIPLNRCCTRFFVSVFLEMKPEPHLSHSEQTQKIWAYFRKHKELMLMKVKGALASRTNKMDDNTISKFLVGACRACTKKEPWNVLMEDLKNYPDTLDVFLAGMVRKKDKEKKENELVWFRDTLYSLVELSKLPWCKVPAAVAITILSADDSFSGMNLRGIRVDGAYLEDGIFDKADIVPNQRGSVSKELQRVFLPHSYRIPRCKMLTDELLSLAVFTDDNGADIVAEVYEDKVVLLHGYKEVAKVQLHIPVGKTALLSRIVRRGTSRVLFVAYTKGEELVIRDVVVAKNPAVHEVDNIPNAGQLVSISHDGSVWCVRLKKGVKELIQVQGKITKRYKKNYTGNLKDVCLLQQRHLCWIDTNGKVDTWNFEEENKNKKQNNEKVEVQNNEKAKEQTLYGETDSETEGQTCSETGSDNKNQISIGETDSRGEAEAKTDGEVDLETNGAEEIGREVEEETNSVEEIGRVVEEETSGEAKAETNGVEEIGRVVEEETNVVEETGSEVEEETSGETMAETDGVEEIGRVVEEETSGEAKAETNGAEEIGRVVEEETNGVEETGSEVEEETSGETKAETNGAEEIGRVVKEETSGEAEQEIKALTPMTTSSLLTWSKGSNDNDWQCTEVHVGEENRKEKLFIYHDATGREEAPRHVVPGTGSLLLVRGENGENYSWELREKNREKEKTVVKLYTRVFGQENKRLNVRNMYVSARRVYYHLEDTNRLVIMKLPKKEPALYGHAQQAVVSDDGNQVGALVRSCGDGKAGVVVYHRVTGDVSSLVKTLNAEDPVIKWNKEKNLFEVLMGTGKSNRTFDVVKVGMQTLEATEHKPTEDHQSECQERCAGTDDKSNRVPWEYKTTPTRLDETVYSEVECEKSCDTVCMKKVLKKDGTVALQVTKRGVTEELLRASKIDCCNASKRTLVAVASGNLYVWRWRHASEAQYNYTPLGSKGEWCMIKRLSHSETVNVPACVEKPECFYIR